jgi:threonine dehydratase
VSEPSAPTLGDLRRAAEQIAPHAHRTAVLTCGQLDARAGARLFFKCENFQRVGAFKFRGATHAVRSLPHEQASAGVATHSSGNHAAAVALAARMRGIAAHIVMPRGAPEVKRAAVEGYGARIVWCEPTQPAREQTLAEVVEQTGAAFIHPYEDPRVVAGQGTAALELLEDVPDLDVVMTPVGGGGLLAGTAAAVTGMNPSVRVIGAEPSGADDAYRSFRQDERLPVIAPHTVCDGLRTSIGELPFSVIRRRVHDIVRVDDRATLEAMRLVWERAKIVIEPSAAVPVAAALQGIAPGARIGIILSGGNVDLGSFFDGLGADVPR